MKLISYMASTISLLAQVNVLTANYGNERTNANLQEVTLKTSNVNPASFGKLTSLPVDGQIYAQPLFVSGVKMPGAETKDVLFVATMNNSVYAFDATGLSRSLWHVHLGTPVPSSALNFIDITPKVGILSTPVIDTTLNAIYVVSDSYESGAPVFRLHALDLASGKEILGGPTTITAAVQGGTDEDGMIAFDPQQHLQRPALLLSNSTVYLAFGSHADESPYHGWILAYDASDITRQVAIFNSTPGGSSGSIWQAGRGLAATPDGDVYAATANGDYDGIANFSQCFLRLRQDLTIVDWFAPADWKPLSDSDSDIGTLGPVLVPGTNLVIGGDKVGNLYLLDRGHMGQLGVDGSSYPQILLAASAAGIFNIALWWRGDEAIIYVVHVGAWTKAFRLINGQIEASPFSQTTVMSDRPFQGMAISANGATAGSGILWLTTGDHDGAGSPGTLHALDALNLNELWNSDMNGAQDRLGALAKFANPTVVNGRVYVATFSGEVVVYGLMDGERPLNNDRRWHGRQ